MALMRFVSWNVNGFRAVSKKEDWSWFSRTQADVVGLQETKASPDQIPAEQREPEGWHSWWSSSTVKKGYSGTAIFTKHQPLSVAYGIGTEEHDKEGRVITLEYEEFYLMCVYTPNSQRELARLSYRVKWEEALLNYIKELDAKKPVIYCGDLNVAHNEIDLKNPKTNHFSAGFSDEERGCFTNLLNSGFVDTFRYLYPNEIKYSWWSYMFNSRAKNVGWRIDYFVVSERLKNRVKDSFILNEIEGSDHCPVGIILE